MADTDSRISYVGTYPNRFTIIRRPHARGSNLANQEQPTITVYGAGCHEFMGRWSTLCGVPTDDGPKTINALDATDAQIIWVLTHDESVLA